MKKLLLALSLSLVATTFSVALAAPESNDAKPAAAPAANDDCEKKAVDKNGKPLAGAAKNSFMKKCQADAKAAAPAADDDCEKKAVGKNGKPLAGAAKSSFMKKCQADKNKDADKAGDKKADKTGGDKKADK